MKQLAVIFVLLMSSTAYARDNGQWENTDPVIREWYRTLKMPDAPQVSCCGEADAYWADKIEVVDDKAYAIITDDRDDAPLGRPHVDVGTRIEIPPHKLKWDRSNPTGHNIIFLGGGNNVFCFVQSTGI